MTNASCCGGNSFREGFCHGFEVSAHQAVDRIFKHRAQIRFIDDVESVAESLHDGVGFVDDGDVLLSAAFEAEKRIVLAADVFERHTLIDGGAHNFNILRPGVNHEAMEW